MPSPHGIATEGVFSDSVPREDLVRIMEAGLAASSGCNKQTTYLVAIDDPDVLERLARS